MYAPLCGKLAHLSNTKDNIFSPNTSHLACPQCGAVYPAGESCRERFERCLALEFEQPESYGSVHHLTVATYMLQHNSYSRTAWLDTRQGLAQFVREGLSPQAARQQNRARLDSGRRSWRITRGEKLGEVAELHWTRTLADVRLEDARQYCADVRQWAAALLNDTENLAAAYSGRVK